MNAEAVERILRELRPAGLMPFCFKALDGHYLLTNDAGKYVFMPRDAFERLLTGKLDPAEDAHRTLAENWFFHDELTVQKVADRFRSKSEFIGAGPLLHIVIPTLRCNLKCVYCHASAVEARREGYDMDMETAKRTVDAIFQAPGRHLTIEFQGGEPLLNWEVVKFVSEYASEKAKVENRNLRTLVVTNLSMLDAEKLDYLVNHQIAICTSLDGHELLHETNRGGYRKLKENVRLAVDAYREKFPEQLPSAIVTVTRHSLPYAKEIIDEYVNSGFEGIFVRPMNPMGMARVDRDRLDYSVDEYMQFYAELLNHAIGVSKNGHRFFEQTAGIYMTKIFCDVDPNFMDLRSPCGAGIGQIAYNFNGDVYTCDEGRMLSMMGDESYRMGNVKTHTYEQLVDSLPVKTLCVASCMDGIPCCSSCVYKPYCGVCPVYNYVEYGDIFLKDMNNRRCMTSWKTLDFLFAKLQRGEDVDVLRDWVR